MIRENLLNRRICHAHEQLANTNTVWARRLSWADARPQHFRGIIEFKLASHVIDEVVDEERWVVRVGGGGVIGQAPCE